MRYWPVFVAVLSALNLVADVSARASRPWIAIGVNLVCGIAWAVLLGQRGASLSRMVSIYGVLTYVFSVAAGVWFFGEHLSPANRAGVALGLIAVVLIGL